MKIDINALPPADQYKLLSSTIVPRPIALVSTWSEKGGDNAAPFSFFNVMGENPPVLVLGLETKRGSGALKDTTINIRDNGQYVVHMVDEALAQAMNICAIDFPSGESETSHAKLELAESSLVKPKRIVAAPVAFECERIALLQVSPGRNIALGKVVMMHVRDGLLDPVTHYIDPEKYHPIGRMFGRLYTRTRDHFEMVVPGHADWLANQADV
ncbi:flavin reductase family protein [Caenimonas aquaedulcis]|uniref:Flavin reductase family protein n=1 Tax=Caenimonas aquaedulcis TaxID=2793270 RepID=A0A931MFU6_9BURK|nr:flavin reductase family protein [Caenimonas aquaedulcis]MBG9386765.1 flavin reductase family protein [Caenimonas aquaedulcis]